MRHNGHKGAVRIGPEQLARGLGWFSIGLGFAELFTPRLLARIGGFRANTGLLRLLGLREIANGIGILIRRHPAGWVQARVAGDAMDLALLGGALVSNPSKQGRVALATAAVAGVTALDVVCSRELSRAPGGKDTGLMVKRSTIINRPIADVYQFWHDFEKFPRFMNHLVSVTVMGDKRSHWIAKGPAGTVVEWDADVIEDVPNQKIVWQSLPGADVDNAGSVRFDPAPGGRGTLVRVIIKYHPMTGKVGATLAKLFGENPEKQIRVDLLRFKQLMETGVISQTEGQPAGRMTSTSRKFDDLVRK